MTQPSRSEFLTPFNCFLNLLRLTSAHIALVTWFVLAPIYLPFWIYVLLSIAVSLVHQREISEWLHEASHFNLISNRKWNDRLVNILVCHVHGLGLQSYRKEHFQHHGAPTFFSNDDLSTAHLAVKTRCQYWTAIMKDLVGYSALSAYFNVITRALLPKSGGQLPPTKRDSFFLSLAIFQLLLVSLLFFANRLDSYLLYYCTQASIYAVLLSRLRLFGQHLRVDPDGRVEPLANDISRTIKGGVLDRLFFASDLMLYHYEHHIHPSLPYRGLKNIHKQSSDVNRFTRNRLKIFLTMYKELR